MGRWVNRPEELGSKVQSRMGGFDGQQGYHVQKRRGFDVGDGNGMNGIGSIGIDEESRSIGTSGTVNQRFPVRVGTVVSFTTYIWCLIWLSQ